MDRPEYCPVAETAKIISGKWTLLIIRDLVQGVKHFSDLERSLVGISPRTLAVRLRELVAHGLVERRTITGLPPRVEYSLSPRGRDLLPLIAAMEVYGRKWLCQDTESVGRD